LAEACGAGGGDQDCRGGRTVDLFSIVPVKRSHSVCAQGGINAAKNLKGEGDTTDSTSTTRFMVAIFLPTDGR